MPPRRKIIKSSPEEEISPIKQAEEPKLLYPPENRPTQWMMPNRLGYVDWCKKSFAYKKSAKTTEHACPLFLHQRFIKDYLQPNCPYRGLLLYHSVGTGKTRSSISVAESLMPERNVIIMLPAALASNYMNEIRRCGSPLFRLDQHWKFIGVGHSKFKEALQQMPVSSETVKKNGGVWYAKSGEASNLATLSSTQRESLERQINELIASRYRFMHYNGVDNKKLAELVAANKGENIFDNKLVIIDEVHNFISRVIGGKPTAVGRRIYKMLMDAKNLKLLLLSGTPMINRPIELGFLLNLVRGYITLYSYKFKNKVPLEPHVYELLDNKMYVDYYTVRNDISEIHVAFLPEGFEFVDKKTFLIEKKKDVVPMDQLIMNLKDELAAAGLKHLKKANPLVQIPALPDEEEVFEDYFVNYNAESKDQAVTNPMLLSRRIQGLVSYYNYYDPADYPELLSIEKVKLKMTDLQFERYLTKRVTEIEQERNAIKFGKRSDKSDENRKQDMKKGSMYRTFTRQLCNFVFPRKIVRPYPSNYRAMAKEMDLFEEDEVKEDKSAKIIQSDDKNKIYDREVKAAIKSITSEDLTVNLHIHSPKFAKIVEKIQESKWLSLVYSQFRNVEGVHLLSLCLDEIGFAELKVKKSPLTGEYMLNDTDPSKPKYIKFTGKKEESKILLDIFNSEFELLPLGLFEQLQELYPNWVKDRNHHGQIIKTLMITQSGAEGISLKNVREVHVTEPYWNDVRLQQVIGRAIRAKSHLALPAKERNVKVYIYQMELTDAQKQDRLLKSHDNGLTSDEYVYDIAQRKSLITEGMLGIMRDTAVDCFLHKDKTGANCFKPLQDDQGANAHAYTQGKIETDLKDHIVDQMKRVVVKERKMIKFVVRKGEQLYYDADTMLIFKESDVQNQTFDSPLGQLKVGANKKAKAEWF